MSIGGRACTKRRITAPEDRGRRGAQLRPTCSLSHRRAALTLDLSQAVVEHLLGFRVARGLQGWRRARASLRVAGRHYDDGGREAARVGRGADLLRPHADLDLTPVGRWAGGIAGCGGGLVVAAYGGEEGHLRRGVGPPGLPHRQAERGEAHGFHEAVDQGHRGGIRELLRAAAEGRDRHGGGDADVLVADLHHDRHSLGSLQAQATERADEEARQHRDDEGQNHGGIERRFVAPWRRDRLAALPPLLFADHGCERCDDDQHDASSIADARHPNLELREFCADKDARENRQDDDPQSLKYRTPRHLDPAVCVQQA
mmetsp:Transcript_17258/g.48411  ORF Transcript_17258/g.48411 Transcript_17258/m.48411 type:complete len:315 (+) Transcript_17258:85-1029(+)